jgi:hypothetical protein
MLPGLFFLRLTIQPINLSIVSFLLKKSVNATHGYTMDGGPCPRHGWPFEPSRSCRTAALRTQWQYPKKSATLVALGFHFVAGDVHGTDNHPYLQMRLQGWRLPVFNGDIQAGLG